jgi:hypothetical protein
VDAVEAKKVTEALKRLGDDERVHVLAWLTLFYEDDGRMRSPRARRRTITLDGVEYHLVRIVRKRPP